MIRILLAIAALASALPLFGADPIKASVVHTPTNCSENQAWNQVGVRLGVESRDAFGSPGVQQRLIELWRWFDAIAQHDSAASAFQLTVTPSVGMKRDIQVRQIAILGGGTADWTPNPRNPEGFHPPDELLFCVVLAERLPSGSLDAVMTFLTPSPPPQGFSSKPADLNDSAKGAVSGPVFPGKPLDPRKPETATKSFDRELDLAGVLLSSVKDQTTGQSVVRMRTTKATGDLFLAPVLNLTALSFQPGKYWLTFFTPMAIEAHASNQPITKDTLSQNTITFGPEYEFRLYLKNSQGVASDNQLRFILKAKSNSDRDFKLIEPKFVAEFRPVWGIVNRDPLDGKNLKGLKGFQKTTGDKLGRKLAPFFGFEEGNSYVRGIPSQALSGVGRFTRGYFGIDAGLNWNNRISVATTQQIYVRGELDNDPVHYMKNTADWTFLASRPSFASALFVTFEKGRVPPFRSSVNSVSLGLRMQSSHWFPSIWR
jgi:hypothetical protein